MAIGDAILPSVDEEGGTTTALKKYVDSSDYDAVYLVAPNGIVFFDTTAESGEKGSNVLAGELAQQGLGRVVQQSLESKGLAFADFSVCIGR